MIAHIEPLLHNDIAACAALVVAAGWNQLPADWAIMLKMGSGECIRDDAGQVVATTVVLPYGSFAWISMVLVDPAHRGRGYATQLLASALASLEAQGVAAVLDATAAGRAVYVPLGFTDGVSITRWQGAGLGLPQSSRLLDAEGLNAAIKMDATAFGSSRQMFMADIVARPGSVFLGDSDGFLLGRAGRTATQIGPLVANSSSQATRLLGDALGMISGPLLIDVPGGRDDLNRWLVINGFTPERSFERMSTGPATFSEISGRTYAIAGPEFG